MRPSLKMEKVKCKHREKKEFKSFRLNYSHGNKDKSKCFGLPKKITVKCFNCDKVLRRYKPLK